jgi:hypothetical protein
MSNAADIDMSDFVEVASSATTAAPIPVPPSPSGDNPLPSLQSPRGLSLEEGGRPAGSSAPAAPSSPPAAAAAAAEPVQDEFDGHMICEDEPDESSASFAEAVTAAAAPSQPAVQASSPAKAEPEPAPKGSFPNDTELLQGLEVLRSIDEMVVNMRFTLGIALLEDPKRVDINSLVHKAIFHMRYKQGDLMRMSPHELNELECALSAHQVFVQGLENEWAARSRSVGVVMDRVLGTKRRNYEAKTVRDQEELVFSTEPNMQVLRTQFLQAQAMSTLLDKMGERFAQLEDGLKRTITLVQMEYQRTQQSGRWVA